MENTTKATVADALAASRPARPEVTTEQLEQMIGGLLSFTFKLVAVKTISWAHD
jgi:hypothetical protein